MAELFLAQAPPRDELVVIKRILPYLAEEPEFVQMFLDEARIAAQLHHPNIVQVHELGSIGESIFIAMEYLAGVDLRRILGEETKFSAAVPYAVAARICAQVAAGLDYAHMSKGVDGRPLELIHRDVSPQNVMVGYDGSVKLVDFGIAKAGAFMERSKPGVIKGKFLYLSPEQVAQERLDHRTDIFALGVMLYEVTTGRAPFTRPTTEGILYAIRFESPSPPHLLRDDYPPELSRIVMRCLVKDREQRYQRATEVQEDLEALLDSGVMRQSDDVAAYVARLLGEEEERTVLHIPVTQNPDPKVSGAAGLRPLPVRRVSSGEAARTVMELKEESATKLARPREMFAAAGLDKEENEPTAIRTMPGRPGALPGGAIPQERASAHAPESSEESTVDERPVRPGASTRRSNSSARKLPSTPEPPSSVERRRTPPVADEPSVSVTPATVNTRSPQRGTSEFDPGFQADDEDVDPTRLIPLQPVPPPEDEESTAGLDNTLSEPGSRPARKSRGRGLLLTLLVLLLLAGAGGAAWFFGLDSLLPADILSLFDMTRATASVEVGNSAGVSEEEGEAPAPGAPSTAKAGASEEPGDTATPGKSPPDGAEEGAAGEASASAEEGLAAQEIPVTFKAPPRTDIRVVGKRQVKPNTALSLPPGEEVRIRYRCPARKSPWTSLNYKVPLDASGPAVVTLDCRAKRRK
jgi:eukaryotic-like serine/threonine-protein kinase